MDVLIVGAGVGGLGLANGLVAAGHRVRVLERATGPRDGGAAVTVFSNGKAAAAGLRAPLDGLGGRIDELEIRDAADRRYGLTDLRVMARRTGFAVETVPRAALLRRLTDGLPPGTVEYGAVVVGAVANGAIVDATGVEQPAGVVVGADGHRSAVRRSVLGDGDARRNGWSSWQGLGAVLSSRAERGELADLANGTHARCYVGPAGLCGLMPAGGGLLQWWFDTEGTPGERAPVDWLRSRFGLYPEPVTDLLATIGSDDIQEYPHVLHDVPDRWGAGVVTLLGDAAHAFPPSQAQGANQALEDAWLLARALDADGPVEGRLRRYEKVRARRVRRVSRLAATEVTNRVPNFAGRLAGKLLSPTMAGRAHTALIRRFSSVLHTDGI
jgi:FAD-dependent urate hydroxylase